MKYVFFLLLVCATFHASKGQINFNKFTFKQTFKNNYQIKISEPINIGSMYSSLNIGCIQIEKTVSLRDKILLIDETNDQPMINKFFTKKKILFGSGCVLELGGFICLGTAFSPGGEGSKYDANTMFISALVLGTTGLVLILLSYD